MHKTKILPPESHPQASRGLEAHGAVERHADPVDFKHPYPSIAQYAELLALRFGAKRTRHASCHAMRVFHEHFQCDRLGPAYTQAVLLTQAPYPRP
jgi:hypothetical protein